MPTLDIAELSASAKYISLLRLTPYANILTSGGAATFKKERKLVIAKFLNLAIYCCILGRDTMRL